MLISYFEQCIIYCVYRNTFENFFSKLTYKILKRTRMSENSPRRAMLAQTLPRIRTSMLSCPAVPRMRENHGRESGVERIVPCFGTSTGPIRPVQRDGRASQRVGPRSRVSGLSLSRRRHVLVTRMTSDERAIAGNRRPIFSPGRRERWVYGRTQNGCRQERSTVSEHE